MGSVQGRNDFGGDPGVFVLILGACCALAEVCAVQCANSWLHVMALIASQSEKK